MTDGNDCKAGWLGRICGRRESILIRDIDDDWERIDGMGIKVKVIIEDRLDE